MDDPKNDWDISSDVSQPTGGGIADRMDRAAILSRREPLRRGNVVYLPPIGDVVILGDLHGDVENLHRVAEWASLQTHPNRYLVLQELLHGGAEDGRGGDRSFRLLEEAAALKCRFRSQVHLILSNHDLSEITGATITKGGQATREQFRRGIENAYGPAASEVHLAYLRFLGALPLAARSAQGLFISHSTPSGEAVPTFDYTVLDRPLTALDCQAGGAAYELLWGRNHDQASADEFARNIGARILVTGHQACLPGVKAPTSRHITLTSDGPLGTFLPTSLELALSHAVVLRQVRKIQGLRAGESR